MLPKAASFQSLASAAGIRVQAKPANHTTPNSKRRQSIDANHSRSRCASHQDLYNLGLDKEELSAVSRPATRLPFVREASAELSVLPAPFNAADNVLDAYFPIEQTWTAVAADNVSPAHVLSEHETCQPSPIGAVPAEEQAAEQNLLRIPKPLELSTLPAVAVVPSNSQDHTCVYHATLNLGYVQELLGNLTHVQRMFKGVADAASPTGTAAAMAAARMLARSLGRAANRVRGVVKEPSLVMLAHEGLHTMNEFGWAEVMTTDEQQADQLGALEMEMHSINGDGVTLSFWRAAADQAWMQIGAASPSAAAGTFQAFTGSPPATPNTVCTSSEALGPAEQRLTAGTAGSFDAVKRGYNLTLADLADQLQSASQSVQSAAAFLQQWLDERKAVAAAAVSATVSAVVSAGTSVVSGMERVVGPSRIMVAAGAQ